jgi:hypothetical protein
MCCDYHLIRNKCSLTKIDVKNSIIKNIIDETFIYDKNIYHKELFLRIIYEIKYIGLPKNSIEEKTWLLPCYRDDGHQSWLLFIVKSLLAHETNLNTFLDIRNAYDIYFKDKTEKNNQKRKEEYYLSFIEDIAETDAYNSINEMLKNGIDINNIYNDEYYEDTYKYFKDLYTYFKNLYNSSEYLYDIYEYFTILYNFSNEYQFNYYEKNNEYQFNYYNKDNEYFINIFLFSKDKIDEIKYYSHYRNTYNNYFKDYVDITYHGYTILKKQ